MDVRHLDSGTHVQYLQLDTPLGYLFCFIVPISIATVTLVSPRHFEVQPILSVEIYIYLLCRSRATTCMELLSLILLDNFQTAKVLDKITIRNTITNIEQIMVQREAVRV